MLSALGRLYKLWHDPLQYCMARDIFCNVHSSVVKHIIYSPSLFEIIMTQGKCDKT